MKNVAELVRKKSRVDASKYPVFDLPLPETLMGIELEVECMPGVVLPDNVTMWNKQHDGSLANGVEYVLSAPMAGKQLSAAIHEIMDGGTYTRTLTGSTHIHMDMLDEETSPAVLQTMVAMVYVMEPMLYAAGDASREWCGYANRLMTGPDEILSEVLRGDLDPDRFRNIYSRNTSSFGRYYGLNMAALIDYGSLEFRYFPTATSKDELVSWVRLVQKFKVAAAKLGSVANFQEVVEDERKFSEFLAENFEGFEHLFDSLGGYVKVRNDFRKGMISSFVGEDNIIPLRFNASKVLSGDRFASFITNPPSDHTTIGYRIVAVPADEMSPPASIDDPTFMILRGSLFYPAHIMDNNGSPAYTSWYLLGDHLYTSMAQNDIVVNTLRTLKDDPSLWDQLGVHAKNDIDHILNLAGEL